MDLLIKLVPALMALSLIATLALFAFAAFTIAQGERKDRYRVDGEPRDLDGRRVRKGRAA